jgi:nucleoid-associated protein YgaU
VRVGVPDRPTSGAATRYTDVRSGQPVRVPARVVVKPGDTLWSIAATELGPNATAEDVATRWPAWYAANRQLIGPDPDLILPGQVLRIPASATGNPVPPTHQEK